MIKLLSIDILYGHCNLVIFDFNHLANKSKQKKIQ